MNRLRTLVLLGIMLWWSGAGCASETKTIRVEDRVQPVSDISANPNQPISTTVTRKMTIVQRHPESRGLLSTTVHFLGDVIAFPFRLIGGLLHVLF